MSTPVWLKDPTILLKRDKLKEIWPLSSMSSEEKINAITRLVIILTFIGYLLTLSGMIFVIGIITLGIVYLLYYIQTVRPAKETKESFINLLPGVNPYLTNPLTYELNQKNYSKPTDTNPLMNVLIPEIYYEPERKAAAPTFNPVVEKEINTSVKQFVGNSTGNTDLEKKIFADLGDELTLDRSMLQYNATANTQIPNDRKAFQEWLYGDMISGKDGNPLALQRMQSGAYNYIHH